MTDKPYIQCPNGDRIYAGEYGRTRSGGKIGPMAPVLPGVPSSGFNSDDPNGIVAKWTDEPAAPEVGTLRELGVKPGDVVEIVNEPSGECIGKTATISTFGCAVTKDGAPYFPDCDEEFGRKYRIISRASDALPHGHARLPSGKVVDLTNPQGTAFGLLDDVYGPGTQEALRAYGGPYEIYGIHDWSECDPSYSAHCVYRVAPKPPEPVVGQVVLFGKEGKRGTWLFWSAQADDTHRLTLPTRDNQLVPGAYTGPDGLAVKVEAI